MALAMPMCSLLSTDLTSRRCSLILSSLLFLCPSLSRDLTFRSCCLVLFSLPSLCSSLSTVVATCLTLFPFLLLSAASPVGPRIFPGLCRSRLLMLISRSQRLLAFYNDQCPVVNSTGVLWVQLTPCSLRNFIA